MEDNLGPLREHLRRVRETLGPRVLLSRLGLALRDIDTTFTPAKFGAQNLAELLRGLPDVGRVEGTRGEREFVFEGEGTPPRGPARLQPHIWRAVTDFRSDGGSWHLDLDTLQLRHSSRDTEGLLQTESERFVLLPRFGADFQKELARSFVREHAPDQVDAMEDALSDEGWIWALSELLEPRGLAERWRAHRASSIVEAALKWAQEHGIPSARILETSDARTRRSAEGTARRGRSDDLADMRALIHDAIDMMSLPELANLPVPPAYLALAASRRHR